MSNMKTTAGRARDASRLRLILLLHGGQATRAAGSAGGVRADGLRDARRVRSSPSGERFRTAIRSNARKLGSGRVWIALGVDAWLLGCGGVA
jgi:hypothetical protein